MSLVNLISTSSFHMMEDEIKRIVKDNPYTVFDMNIVSLEEIIEEANYFSLFGDTKYLVVKNATIFSAGRKSSDSQKSEKKDELLLKYLEQPNQNTILIFTTYDKVDSKKRIVKNIKDNYNLVVLTDPSYKDMQSMMEKYLKDNKYTIDSKTSYYIYEACQGNYDLVINELNKVMLYYGSPCKIKMDDVVNIVAKVVQDNNFKFIDVVMKKNMPEAMEILNDLLLQKVQPIMLMIMISKEIRNTLLVLQYRNSRSKQELMKMLGLKFDFQLDKLINNSYNFSMKELEDLLLLICDYDYKIKRGKIGAKLALELIIMKMSN